MSDLVIIFFILSITILTITACNIFNEESKIKKKWIVLLAILNIFAIGFIIYFVKIFVFTGIWLKG